MPYLFVAHRLERGVYVLFMNRAVDFHRARLIRDGPSAIGIAPDLVIPHSPQLPPKRPDVIFPDRLVGTEQHCGEELRNASPLRSFHIRASFSRSEYYDRTDMDERSLCVLSQASHVHEDRLYETGRVAVNPKTTHAVEKRLPD
jgi:hypothetical protein